MMQGLPRRTRRIAGFTLLELLVVMVIVGIMLGVVTINAMPSQRQHLQREAQRIALLLQSARDEAIVRNRLVAFEADSERYRFMIRDKNEWQPIAKDELLRERPFELQPMNLSISPPLPEGSNPLRITFGREPVDKPFALTLSVGEYTAVVRADGVGHFTVE
jgi:general secretion pathway protein H